MGLVVTKDVGPRGERLGIAVMLFEGGFGGLGRLRVDTIGGVGNEVGKVGEVQVFFHG